MSTSGLAALAILTHVRRAAIRLKTTNYLGGISSSRFILASLFLYVIFVGVFIIYGAARRSGTDTAQPGVAGETTSASDVRIRASVSGSGIAFMTLALGFIFACIIYATRITGSIPYEYSYIVLLAWVVIGAYIGMDCLCCDDPLVAGQQQQQDAPHHVRGSVSTMTEEIVRKMGTCNNTALTIPVVSVVINVVYTAILLLLYAAHAYDMKFSTVYTSVRSAIYLDKLRGGGVGTDDIEGGVIADRGGQIGYTSPVARTVLCVAALIVALIPVECSNPHLMSLLEFYGRVVVFLCVFLLRLCNDYSRRYVLKEKIKSLTITSTDERLYGPVQMGLPNFVYQTEGRTHRERTERERARRRGLQFDTLEAPPTPRDIGVAAAYRIDIVTQFINRRITFDVFVAMVLASSCLVLCKWFLLLVIVQLGYEISLQYISSNSRGILIEALHHMSAKLGNATAATFAGSGGKAKFGPTKSAGRHSRKNASISSSESDSEDESDSDSDEDDDAHRRPRRYSSRSR
jgi:hypothetical protein